jgi:hypothetical protein
LCGSEGKSSFSGTVSNVKLVNTGLHCGIVSGVIQEAVSMLENTTDYYVDGDVIHWETVRVAYSKALATSEKARAAGLASGAARRNIRSANDEQTMNHPLTTNQKPLTTNQEYVPTVEEGIPFKAAKEVEE